MRGFYYVLEGVTHALEMDGLKSAEALRYDACVLCMQRIPLPLSFP